jgi:hypothetical protein
MLGGEVSDGLRDRVAGVLRDFVPSMRPGEVVWCADAVLAELQRTHSLVEIPPPSSDWEPHW